MSFLDQEQGRVESSNYLARGRALLFFVAREAAAPEHRITRQNC
jgi:hypothetical protein